MHRLNEWREDCPPLCLLHIAATGQILIKCLCVYHQVQLEGKNVWNKVRRYLILTTCIGLGDFNEISNLVTVLIKKAWIEQMFCVLITLPSSLCALLIPKTVNTSHELETALSSYHFKCSPLLLLYKVFRSYRLNFHTDWYHTYSEVCCDHLHQYVPFYTLQILRI